MRNAFKLNCNNYWGSALCGTSPGRGISPLSALRRSRSHSSSHGQSLQMLRYSPRSDLRSSDTHRMKPGIQEWNRWVNQIETIQLVSQSNDQCHVLFEGTLNNNNGSTCQNWIWGAFVTIAWSRSCSTKHSIDQREAILWQLAVLLAWQCPDCRSHRALNKQGWLQLVESMRTCFCIIIIGQLNCDETSKTPKNNWQCDNKVLQLISHDGLTTWTAWPQWWPISNDCECNNINGNNWPPLTPALTTLLITFKYWYWTCSTTAGFNWDSTGFENFGCKQEFLQPANEQLT